MVVEQGDKVSDFFDNLFAVNEPEAYVAELLLVLVDNGNVDSLPRHRTRRSAAGRSEARTFERRISDPASLQPLP